MPLSLPPRPLMAHLVKNLSASVGDTGLWVPSLGQEDPLEEGTATHSSGWNPVDRGDRLAAVHGVAKSWT